MKKIIEVPAFYENGAGMTLCFGAHRVGDVTIDVLTQTVSLHISDEGVNMKSLLDNLVKGGRLCIELNSETEIDNDHNISVNIVSARIIAEKE